MERVAIYEKGIKWCTYVVGGYIVMAFAFCHTQRALRKTMTNTVNHIMSTPPP